jgi:predicted dehydrogenase
MTLTKIQPLKAVLVGCGNISRIWVPAILEIPDLQLIGLVDIVLNKTQILAHEFNLKVETDSDLGHLLKRLKPDLVFDCTTPENRLTNVSAAFAMGCSVLVEKPLADTLENAVKLVALAKAYTKVCATVQNHRYSAGIRTLAHFVRSGQLGQITQCSSNFFIGARFNDYRKDMKHVLLRDMAIHTFDAARFILDEEPVSVYCREWNPSGSWYAADAAAVAVFEFTNGIVYTYQGSWSSQGLRTPWESQWRINGTRGSISWNGEEDFKCQILPDEEGDSKQFIDVSVPLLASPLQGHLGAIEDFVQAIRTNRKPPTDRTDNLKSLKMVFSAIQSSMDKKEVKIDI